MAAPVFPARLQRATARLVRAGACGAAHRLHRPSLMTGFEPISEASSFRRMAAAMWSSPNDPTIYGSMDVDVTNTLSWLEAERLRTGQKLSITHLVARAV